MSEMHRYFINRDICQQKRDNVPDYVLSAYPSTRLATNVPSG
jgi:hypothetical protein